jgi:AcrR family transcriptional regulator
MATRRAVAASDVGRRRRSTADTRERIIAAALEAFAELGFDGATTRGISERAGVNQGLITYYFASKLALWQAAVEQIFGELRDAFAEHVRVLKDADAGTRLRLMIRHYVRFAAARPELHRLMIQEGKHDGPRMQWLVDTHVRPLFELSTGSIAAAQEAGIAPRVSPLHLHYILIGAVAHLFVVAPECRRLSGKDPLDPERIEEHADAITALLLGADESERATLPRRGRGGSRR